jgi:hypothetical protein
MRMLKVGSREVAIEADPGSLAEIARQRVNGVALELASIVFKESPATGLSAMVSFLAAMLADEPEPRAKTEAIGRVLQTLVELNINREVPASIYIL